jgi:hypothetical protein
MANAKELAERARMFEERAEKAIDPISRQHYREMAAHYRALSVEHQDVADRTLVVFSAQRSCAASADRPASEFHDSSLSQGGASVV